MQFRHEVQIVKVCSQFVQIAVQCHEVLIAVLRSHCGTNSFSFPHILCCCCSSLALHFLDGQEGHEDHYQNNHQGQGSAEAASNVPLIMGGQALGSEVRVVSELCEAPQRHRHRALERLGLGAGEGGGKDVEGHQGQQGHEGDEGQEVSGAAWRRSNEGHEGPLERRPKSERSVCASLSSQCSGPPLIADKMFSEIVARVCCLAPAIDRFDCMFMTNCAWLAMLSLVYMALLTLAAIRYNEYSLSGNSLHRCHACDVQVDVLLALEFLSSNIVCVRHGGRHSTCEAGSQRRCPTEVLT